MSDKQELLGEEIEKITDVNQLIDDFNDGEQVDNKSFHKGDTMVLIADYTDDSDYAVYMDLNDEGLEQDLSETDKPGSDPLLDVSNEDTSALTATTSIVTDTIIKDLDETGINGAFATSGGEFEHSEFQILDLDDVSQDTSVENLYASLNDNFVPTTGRRTTDTAENNEFVSAPTTVKSESDKKEKIKDKDKAKNKKKIKKPLIAIAIILIVLVGVSAYRFFTVKNFPAGAVVNGINVGNLDVKQAAEKMNVEKNKITLVKDGKDLGESTTAFKFESKEAMKKAMIRAAVDPYAIYKLNTKEGLKAPLKVAGGIDQTVPMLLNFDKGNSEVEQTKDAYVDVEKAEIVEAVQGVNIDYIKVAKSIAKQQETDPISSTFKFKSKDYYAKPKIRAKDLGEELEFVKKYIVNGMDVNTPGNSIIHITPTELSKIIKYSKKGPEYSKEGADEVATSVINTYKGEMNTITLKTTKGDRTVPNYDFNADVDEKATADSIYEAAKSNGEVKANVITGSERKLNMSTRVEIDLTNQNITLVVNNHAQGPWPIVSGGPGHRTPPGLFSLAYKTSPAVLKGYNDDGSKYASPVKYWMPFNGGIGIHDADGWMTAYGGNIYVYGGSHGCINVSTSTAQIIYSNINSGTPIIVHY